MGELQITEMFDQNFLLLAGFMTMWLVEVAKNSIPTKWNVDPRIISMVIGIICSFVANEFLSTGLEGWDFLVSSLVIAFGSTGAHQSIKGIIKAIKPLANDVDIIKK